METRLARVERQMMPTHRWPFAGFPGETELARREREQFFIYAGFAMSVMFAVAALLGMTPAWVGWMGGGCACFSTIAFALRHRQRREAAVSQEARVREEDAAEGAKALPSPAPVEPWEGKQRERQARMENCARNLRAAMGGMLAYRELVGDPEKTLTRVLAAGRALEARETALRRAIASTRPLGSMSSPAELEARRAADGTHAEAIDRALDALDTHADRREQLQRAVARLEAEQVALLYTLESLYLKVEASRHGTAEAATTVPPEIRQSLEELSAEVGAVAEALEFVAGLDASPRSNTRPPVRSS